MPLISKPVSPPTGAVLARLHAINSKHGYMPEEDLRVVADELGIPLSQLYSAATFYSAFSLKPRGLHTVQICQGTACYMGGGGRLLEKIETTLGAEQGETTEDGMFTIEIVHCFGMCNMSPVIRVDEDTYGRLKADRIPRVLKRYRLSESGKKGSK